MPFDAIFRLHRRTRPDKTAIIDGDRRIDYATLDRMIDGACHALHARGVRREMLVGLGLADHAEHVIAMIALARLGAVPRGAAGVAAIGGLALEGIVAFAPQ